MERKILKVNYKWKYYILEGLKFGGLLLLLAGLGFVLYSMSNKSNTIQDNKTNQIIEKIKNNYNLIGQEATKQRELRKEINERKKRLEKSIKKVIILEKENEKLKKQLFTN